MSSQPGRYTPAHSPRLAEGWSLRALTPPSRLFGANGIRTGPDGRIYVAQVVGSQISAIDVTTGAIETIVPMGGAIVGPDDLVFDPEGNLYATEFTEGRVAMRAPNGTVRVINGEMPCANPITFHQGRLFAGECRPGARIMELDRNGGAPRVLLADIPMANAMEVGPDGLLYFPVMALNEIWRIPLEGGTPEKVAGDLGVPDSVKFDKNGQIISTQVVSGQVLRIDPRTGAKTVLADIAPGLDNVTFVGDRIFVSSISGQINEILPEGRIAPLVPDGLHWPLGLAMGADGLLYIADGAFHYTLDTRDPGAKLKVAGMLFTPGSPGYTRGVAIAAPGELIVTTAKGEVARWRPAQQESEILAQGFDRLYGVAITPGGAIVFADAGTGRVMSLQSGTVEILATGLHEPTGIAIAPDGACLVAETDKGRVLKLTGNKSETLLDGLQKPQGLLVRGNQLYIVDAAAKELIEFDLTTGKHQTIAANLPIGAPTGVTPKPLRAVLPLAGFMGPFAGLTAAPDGTLYLSADAAGTVLALEQK